ncbi:helix-turn-helix domain-containing protein [Streptomyces sp. 15-116A]|uniref:helix-turn-helix domain-containing protein n=1 Tax=Streptomyces sp. 15-116A TaxID=2259035 RepID=UPI0021B2910D|nr:helix-turn-helix domain-containing protein [Streptomyces sp. 15-116A]MCT7353153.1 helix-turn-helix domain-containing protein [Streptomyces sp. 15-116A]
MLRTPVDGTRMHILTWLKEPVRADTGATAEDVAARFGLSHPVALTHLRLLTATGLLRTTRLGGHLHFRRDEVRIADVSRRFEKGW